MQEYKLKYLPLFYDDLNSITSYISTILKNEKAANDLTDSIEQAIKQRALSPTSYSQYKSKKNRDDVYYKINVKNYYIFYTVDETNHIMELRRIIYNKRDLKNIPLI